MAEKKGLFKHFASISCSETLEQNQRDALEATELVRLSQEEKKKRKELTYVGPGRPKKELKLVDALKDTDTDTHCSVSLSTSSSVLSGDNKRGSYHNWFGSDLIHDILQAVSMVRDIR
jgi:translation initiation factor 1 (eIF-1/SUI1)